MRINVVHLILNEEPGMMINWFLEKKSVFLFIIFNALGHNRL